MDKKLRGDKMNRQEKELKNFLTKYPNQWHSVAQNRLTLRALAYLMFKDSCIQYDSYTKQVLKEVQ